MHTRAFGAPLFGTGASTTIRLNAGQRTANGSFLSAGFYRGFPLVDSYYSVEADRVPWNGGLLNARAGEIAVGALGESAFDSYALRGASFRWRRQSEEWMVYAGDSRYPTVFLNGLRSDPAVAGVEYLRRFANSSAAAGLMYVKEGTTVDDEASRLVARGDYEMTLTHGLRAFVSSYLTEHGSTAFRTGARLEGLRGDITAALFTFDDHFPLVYPLFRPGESGAEVRGSYRLTELSRVYGLLTYLTSELVLGREHLRGHAGWSYAYGSDGPFFDVSYHRDELTHLGLTASRESVIADRLSAALSRRSLAESYEMRLDHVEREGFASRTQLLTSYRRLVGVSSMIEGAAVLQHEQSALGVTAEATWEQPIRWPYSLRIGGGAAVVERGNVRAGEGVALLGLSRRFVGQLTGWYAQIEAKRAFPIGLPRSGLATDSVTVSLGNRLGWTTIDHARSILASFVSPSDFGVIEGRVTYAGGGVANIPVIVDGQVLTVTRSDGGYRVPRTPIGVISLAIDTSVLEPGFVVSGAASRTVLVPPRGAARADFEIVRYVALAGAVIRCVAGEVRPIAGARLALLSDSFVQTATTSSSGSFEIDSIPPGSYQIVIDPASVPDVPPSNIPRVGIELTNDRLGYVVGLECDGGGTVAVPPATQPAGAVSGTVTLNDASVIGAEILVDGQPATRTRNDGTFVLETPAGERFISVRLPAMGASALQGEANRRIEVTAGGREELRFDFRGSAQLTGRLTVCRGGAEVPVPEAGVYLLGGRHAETRTGVDGIFTLSDVTPGRYLLILDREALLAAGAAAGDIPRLFVDLRGDQAQEIRVGCHRGVP